VGLLAVVVAAVCIRLGIWQLDRLEERRTRNEALAAALALPPLRLEGDSLLAVLRDPPAYAYRRARVRGELLPEQEVVQRGRSYLGKPGVHLITPLRVTGSRWGVVLDRGWAPSPDAMTVDPAVLARHRVVEAEGLLFPFAAGVEDVRHAAVEMQGRRVEVVQRLGIEWLQSRSEVPLLPLYLQLLPEEGAPAGGVQGLPPPELDEGPHLGYAVQWFSFAAIALLGPLILLIRSRRERRPPRV